MGYRDAPRPMRNIKGVRSLTGGSFPAMTWHNYMTDALADVPPTDFTAPAPIKRVQIVSRVLLLAKRARKGIDPGARRGIAKTGVNTYEELVGPPGVAAPPYIAPPTTVPSIVVVPNSLPPAPPVTIEEAATEPSTVESTAPVTTGVPVTVVALPVASTVPAAFANVTVVSGRNVTGSSNNSLTAIATTPPTPASAPAALATTPSSPSVAVTTPIAVATTVPAAH